MTEAIKTNAAWKLLNSTVNVAFVLILSLPLLWIFGFSLEYRLCLVLLFFAYQLTVTLMPKHRDFGDLVTKTVWIEKYPLRNHILFAVLYTASFSTFVIWIIFPFDLLLFNLLCVQLPFVLKTGYTLHGYLSGRMVGTRQR